MILDNIYVGQCLTLDERIEEVQRIKKEWFQFGISIEPFIVGKGKKLSKCLYNHIDIDKLPPVYSNSTDYPTWWKANTYNAWLSHRKIFQSFIQSGLSTLLLLEDDSFIEEDAKDILEKVSPYLETIGWDMLYLGSYPNPGSWSPTQHENVMRLSGAGGFHSILIKDYVVKALLEFDPIGPYDDLSGRFLHDRFNCYGIYPCIVSQKDNYYSNIEEKFLPKPSRWSR